MPMLTITFIVRTNAAVDKFIVRTYDFFTYSNKT